MSRILRKAAHRVRVTRLALSTIFSLTTAAFCDSVALHLLDLANGLRAPHRMDNHPGDALPEETVDALLEQIRDEVAAERSTHTGDGQPVRTLTVHNPDPATPTRAVVVLPKPRTEEEALAAAKAAHPAGKGRTLEPLA